MAPKAIINWAIYDSLPPGEAKYQLAHINDSKRAAIATAYIICVPIIFLAVVLRFVSRRIGRTKYGADDWIMLMGLVTISPSEISYGYTFSCAERPGDRFWLLQTVFRAY